MKITIILLTLGVTNVLCSYNLLLLYQLGGYRLGELLRAIKRKPKTVIFPYLFAFPFTLLSFVSVYLIVLAIPFAVTSCVLSVKKSRVKLRLTNRFIRFLSVFIILSPLTVFSLVFAHALTYPIEEVRNRRFVLKRTARLRNCDRLIKIGITGSYGKTTTKNILAHFLSVKYKVATTKENYNTPMGIALSMDFPKGTQIFIAEMGARHKGDIDALCRIVRPNFGIITAIGAQHLETFKSEENIRNEKLTLAYYLAVRNKPVVTEKKYGYLDSVSVEETCKITSVSVSERGTSFCLTVKGNSVEIETPLLGKHIPSVIAECTLCSLSLGITLDEIKKASKTLKPVAHRLELLYNGSDVIIDDAYNANEQSVINALELLSCFDGKVKIVVTPGVVEAGEMQEEINERIGSVAGALTDYAIFVGSNAKALSRGAKDGSATVMAVKTLEEATEKLKTIKGERVILFSNDLPDNY